MKKILSIDGGGIRGVIPAVVIEALEYHTGKSVAQSFDMIAGTSVGGILALCLSNGYSGRTLVNLFRDHGKDIFPRSMLTSVKGLFAAKYHNTALRELLESYLSNKLLSESGSVVIPSYELNIMSPFIFRSNRAKLDREYDYLAVDVALATSAAPTYFKPADIWSVAGRAYRCIDGGMYANNPAMMAYIDMLKSSGPDEKFMVVSIGTGQESISANIGGWGLSQWIRPILDVVFDGIGDTISYELSQILDEGNYYRLQTKTKGKLDDISRIDEHTESALKIVSGPEFRALCQIL